MELNLGIRLGIYGGSGCGKSTLARAIFRHYKNKNLRDRYYVLDVYTTHLRGNQVLPGLQREGFVTIPVNSETLDRIKGDSNEDKVKSIQWTEMLLGVTRAVIIFELPEDLRILAINDCARSIRQLKNSVVLIDEIGHFVPATQRRVDELGLLLTSGRPNGIDTIFVSQHANFTNPLLKDATNWVIAFRTMSEREIEFFSSRFGEHSRLLAHLDASKREFLAVNSSGAVYKSSVNEVLNSIS